MEQNSIKIFLQKFIFFLLPIIILFFLVTIILPINFWSFRSWEALSKFEADASIGPFYPNQTLSMIEEGDLAHGTEFATQKNTTWKTDSLGFRNNEVPANIDILFVGDSFVAGAGLSQQDLIDVVTAQETKKVTYQMAPLGLHEALELIDGGLISKPKTIILSTVERNILELNRIGKVIPDEKKKQQANNSPLTQSLLIYKDRISKNSAQKKLSALLTNPPSSVYQSPIDKNVFFYSGLSARIAYTQRNLDETTAVLQSYQEYLQAKDITFMFLPCPNKESVYYELIPFPEQPNFLYSLHDNLQKKGVNSLNTLDIFTKHKEDGLLYYTDDSHWTPLLTKLTAKEIAAYLKDITK